MIDYSKMITAEDKAAAILAEKMNMTVTPRQAKLALLSVGLLDDVEAAIASIPDPALKRTAQIEWEYAQEIKRGWPLLVQVADAMGMTSADLDELFTQAALL